MTLKLCLKLFQKNQAVFSTLISSEQIASVKNILIGDSGGVNSVVIEISDWKLEKLLILSFWVSSRKNFSLTKTLSHE